MATTKRPSETEALDTRRTIPMRPITDEEAAADLRAGRRPAGAITERVVLECDLRELPALIERSIRTTLAAHGPVTLDDRRLAELGRNTAQALMVLEREESPMRWGFAPRCEPAPWWPGRSTDDPIPVIVEWADASGRIHRSTVEALGDEAVTVLGQKLDATTASELAADVRRHMDGRGDRWHDAALE